MSAFSGLPQQNRSSTSIGGALQRVGIAVIHLETLGLDGLKRIHSLENETESRHVVSK
jgi:hypothetical protein